MNNINEGMDVNVRCKKYYTEEDMIKMDCDSNFISFANRKLFYNVFSDRLNVLKRFIFSQLELNISDDDCVIILGENDIYYENIENDFKIRVRVNTVDIKLFIKREIIRVLI